MTIKVTENSNGTFTIDWDENDPQESIFNNWTEQDFINAIEDYLKALQKSGEIDLDYKIGESIETIEEELHHITEAESDDWEDFWGENWQDSWGEK